MRSPRLRQAQQGSSRSPQVQHTTPANSMTCAGHRKAASNSVRCSGREKKSNRAGGILLGSIAPKFSTTRTADARTLITFRCDVLWPSVSRLSTSQCDDCPSPTVNQRARDLRGWPGLNVELLCERILPPAADSRQGHGAVEDFRIAYDRSSTAMSRKNLLRSSKRSSGTRTSFIS